MRPRTITLLLAASAVLASMAVTGASAMPQAGATLHHAQRGTSLLTGIPSGPVADLQTHTLYVPIQCRSTCNGPPGKVAAHVLDLINTATCTPHTVSGCKVIRTAVAGMAPIAVAIDQQTDTLYVANGGGAVTVLDGGRCNASVGSGCGKPLATINTGGFDVADTLDPRTHTLYVAAPSGDVFVVNVSRCNSHTTAGCRQTVRNVKDPRGADAIGVEVATDTVYAADGGTSSPGNTVTVIDGAQCNGSTASGCGQTPRTVTVGSAPYWLTVDQATNTVYVANYNDNTVSVIDGAACNGAVTSGCGRHPRTVISGGGPGFLVLDPSRHTLFAMNNHDDTISEINTRTCNGHTHSGCPVLARNERIPFNPPTGENPGAFALAPATGTAYLISFNNKFLAAVSIKRCNALTTQGCRLEAPSRPINLAFPEVDPATNTIYAADRSAAGIEVLNGATCNTHDLSGCKPVAKIPFADPQANLGSIDHSTHTLYAGDTFSDTVWAIDIAHCNAHDTSGCNAPAPKMTVGPQPGLPVLNPATHTLYVAEAVKSSSGYNYDEVAVLNAATCNAKVSSGCGQTPATIQVGANTFFVALSRRTNTVYAAVLGSNFLNRTVYVINGAICNASDHSGCAGAVVAKAKVGEGPSWVTVNDATHSVYVDNNANGDLPGTVSVLNGATCNGSHTTGCSKSAATVSVGQSPTGMAFDARVDRLYVADYSHATVSIVDLSHCTAADTSGCHAPAPERQVGSQPGFVFVNSKEGTVYAVVHRSGPTGSWSIFPAVP